MRGQAARIPSTGLKPGEYLNLVGIFDHCTDFAVYHPRQDDHHLYLWLDIYGTGSLYECAINTRLSGQSRMQMACFREESPPERWPAFGMGYCARLAYRTDLLLVQHDFHEVHRHSLTDELKCLLLRCDRLQVLGFAYDTGNGVHDVHLNGGESPASTRRNCTDMDGALVLYYSEKPGVPAHALWVCLKFPSQEL